MYQYGAGTNVGNVRDNNEDSYVCDDEKDLWIVADGMGGLGFGEVASAITTFTVTRMVREGHGVNQAIEVAHRNIKEYAESDGLGTNMGTTIVLLLSHGSLYNIFWVGDSRAYLFDKSGLSQITVDHSLVQSLIDQGELTREEAHTDPRKNAVTRALGVQELETVRADSISERWKPSQKVLLCSDGLTDCVTDADIESIMRDGGSDQEIVDRLIHAALEGGGKDNVTIILISAPKTAKIADTDTHVPAADDTQVPGDDTYVPAIESAPTATMKSINLADRATEQTIKAAESSLVTVDASDAGYPVAETTHHWSKFSAVAALFLLVTVWLFQSDEPTRAVPANFESNEAAFIGPMTRNFPAYEFPARGTVLQVGLFSRLAGAELQQTRLTSLGLSPHIEKRASQESIRYAVVLGPLDVDDHRKATQTLDQHQLSYFHRTEDHS